MIKATLYIMFCLSTAAFAQQPMLDLQLTVSDNAGNAQTLHFGLDAAATNGIDANLNENELPPFPPSGIFEARFIGDDISLSEIGLGSYQDYRTGGPGYSGIIVHELKYQAGSNGSAITIGWNLPAGATGLLEDLLGGVVVSQAMQDSGTITISNLALDKLKMTVTYNNIMTSVDEAGPELPDGFELEQNYPNPFNPTTMLSYKLAISSEVNLSIFNMAGQMVRTLVDGSKAAGAYKVRWDGRDQQGAKVASGLYLYRLRIGEQIRTRSMLLTK